MSPDERDRVVDRLLEQVHLLAEKIRAPQDLLPVAVEPSATADGLWLDAYYREADDGDDDAGDYIALFQREGGILFQPIETGVSYADEFLYLLFLGVTFQLAARSAGGDGRETLLAQENLLETLKTGWGARAALRPDRAWLRDEDRRA